MSARNCLFVFAVAVAIVSVLGTVGCRRTESNPDAPPPRIITHSPALTKLIFDMGLGDHLVGVTNWCELPAGTKYENLPRVADAHGVKREAILVLKPDIILTQSNATDKLFSLPKGIRVERVRLESLEDLIRAIDRIGKLTNREDLAEAMLDKLTAKLAISRADPASPGVVRPAVLFTSGHDAPMIAADGTYIGDIIKWVGGRNVGQQIPGNQLWRKAKIESIIAARPDVLIIRAPAGREARIRQFWLSRQDIPAARNNRIYVVTDDKWLWLGSHAGDLAEQIKDMLPDEPVWEVSQ